MSEPVLRLFSDGLLSKHGFGDGYEPDEWLDWCEARGIEFPYTGWHSTLRELVARYLLPALDQHVTVVHVDTIHNPVRAQTVNGADAEQYWHASPDRYPELTPEYVEIPMAEVARIAAGLSDGLAQDTR